MTLNLPQLISEPLGAIHDRAAFSCGTEQLDVYLHRFAEQDQRRDISRVFVITGDEPKIILGYYTLSSFSIDLAELPDEQSRRLPRHPEIPAALIGRLAVARASQGQGMGKALLSDALNQIMDKSSSIGIYSVVVDDQAAALYEKKTDF